MASVVKIKLIALYPELHVSSTDAMIDLVHFVKPK